MQQVGGEISSASIPNPRHLHSMTVAHLQMAHVHPSVVGWMISERSTAAGACSSAAFYYLHS